MRTHAIPCQVACLLLLAAFTAAEAAADSPRPTWKPPESPEAVRAYWTPERMAAARPLAIPVVDIRRARAAFEPTAGGRASHDWRPRRPSVRVEPDLTNYLLDVRYVRRPRPSDLRRPATAAALLGIDAIAPKARGAQGLDFTSSRLIPEDARMTWPYSTVGKLFFRDGGSNFVCSAAVISARVVGTAGHCVFSGGDFVTNVMFVPAYHQGQAPFGEWIPNFLSTSDEWADDEDVPNAEDWGLMVMDDQMIDGATRKIGDVTGWLGYKTNSLFPNQVHVLGYPGNIDRGQRMHQVTTGQHDLLPPNTAFFGSDMEGGSSGGPWVQNFGEKGQGGYRGSRNKNPNRVVAFTSYASTDGRDEIQGASNLTNAFKQLFNQACSDAPGNCRKKGKPNPN